MKYMLYSRGTNKEGVDFMKMERISENQIRCTLNKEDLLDRQLRISELAYGSDKAKELFRDMMQQASYELGFEAEDIPLMIEAIPVSPECLVLIITKVEDPDELDTRFSKFSSDSDLEEYEYDLEDDADSFPDDLVPTLSEVTDPAEDVDSDKSFIPLSNAIAPHNVIQKEQPKQENVAPAVNTIRIFSFDSLEGIIDLASQIHSLYHGANSLYKDTEREQYYLILSKDDHTLDEFNRICNTASEFGKMERSNYGTLAYYEEHFDLITKSNAIGVLYNL